MSAAAGGLPLGAPDGYTVVELPRGGQLRDVASSSLGRATRSILTMRPGIRPMTGGARRSGSTPRATSPLAVPAQVAPIALRLARASAAIDHLARYQHLMGLPARDTLPPGFVHILGFPAALALLARADFPLPALGMVHLAGAVRQASVIPADQELAVTVWAQDLAAHPRGTTVDVHTLATASGQPVWHGVATYLAKGAWLVPPQAHAASETPVQGAGAPSSGWSGRHEWRLGREIGRRYAAVSGDYNPIHTSRAAARAFGFSRTLAHGMYTAGRALAELGAPEVVDWRMQFAKPLLLPATVVLEFARAGRESEYRVVSRDGARVHVTGSVAKL